VDIERLRGRNAETTAIERTLDRLAGGEAVIACIAGEPGIGKTSLLAALLERAASRRMVVLSGSCAEFEHGVPFGPFVEALDDHLEALDRRSLDRLGADRVARLASVLPALARRADGAPAEPGHERHRTLGAVRALLEALAARHPLVLAIDDLHWADDGSLELVSHLIRRPPRAPVLLALAYRPRQLAERTGSAHAAFIAGAADELIEPGPLSREQAGELIAGRVEPARIGWLVTESGGNPFYLEQLARNAPGAGGLKLPGVPPAVSGSLEGELGQLSEDDRAVCLAAAVVGDPFESHLVAAAAARPEDVALGAIDALVRAGIVHQADVPRRFRFRHPIVRRAAYESADPGWRVGAHRRVAAVLAESGAGPLERAHHLEAAAAPGDVAAAAVLAEAGRAVAGRAPAIASRWYAAAVRLMPATADPTERIGLLVAMAAAQGSAGRLDDSRRTLLGVLDALPPELDAVRLRVLPYLALAGHMLGRHGEATALLRRALAELPDPRAPEAAELGISTSLDCLYELDYEGMPGYAADADRAARASGDAGLAASAAGVSAVAHYFVGELPTALAECERAVELAAPRSDAELAGRLEGVLSIAWAAMCLERHADCIAAAGRGLAVSRSTGQGHLVVPLTIARAVAWTWGGELGGAAFDADDLIDAARLSGVDQSIAWALTLRGWIATLAGALELASECGEEACAIAHAQARPSYFVTHAILHLAETRLEQGRAAECIAAIVTAAGGPGLPGCERAMRSRHYEILTRASLALGRLDEARMWADRAGDAVAGSPLGGRRCEAGLADAAVQLAVGESGAAEACALEAAEAAEGAGDRVLAARGRLLAARARAPRDRQGAIELLEEARTEFDACGAVRRRDETVRELRHLGRRIGAGGRRGHGPSALSDREREVAQLVTDGLTNRDIAARLFLSDKTVETHLSAVFRKLAVRGRAAVGTALARENGDGAA
jgi:DNA-binding CsgD family transcriptional regulator/tetratricopeptide (TPR) repeat protein